MRVLHIMSGFGGGISSFIRNKATALVNEDVIFDIVTYDECSEVFLDVIHQTKGQVYRLVNPKQHGWKAFKSSFEQVLMRNKYDAIHCHIRGYRVIPYYWLAKKYVKKFYIHAHDSNGYYDKSIKKRIQIWLNQQIDRFISDSNLGCGQLAIEVAYGNISKSQQMIIPNSIELVDFLLSEQAFGQQKIQLRQKYGIEKNAIVIGQIGRLTRVKNHDKTFALAQEAKLNGLNIKFIIVGAGSLEEELKRKVEELNLSDFVTFIGRIEPIQSIMPLFDVMLLPSLFEGLPTVAVEAQAMGIPILLSDTITKEVDFELNLVHFLSLSQSNQEWIKKVMELSQIAIPEAETRIKTIEAYHFSNEGSAQLYLDFLRGKITTHVIK